MVHLALEQLCRAFPGVRALDGFSLTVHTGEHLAVLGPSGSGKSTLLRLIAGLDQPTSGRIVQAGRDLAGVPPEHRGLGMVFQSPALLPDRDVARNLALPLELQRRPLAEREARVRELAAAVGLTQHLHRRPAELSGGEAQRVALGRALIGGARLLLLDEPGSGLDTTVRRQFRQLLRDLRQQHSLTLIEVTHDQSEALACADRIALLESGHGVACDTPRALYHRPSSQAVARLLGDPPMNWMPGQAGSTPAQFACAAGSVPAPGSTPRDVQLGIRPERVRWISGSPERTTDGAVAWPAIARRSECGGALDWLAVDLGSVRWWVRDDTSGTVPPGTLGTVRFAVDDLHWFEASNGLRIQPD